MITSTGSVDRAPMFVDDAYAALTTPERIIHMQLRSVFHTPGDDPSTAEIWTRGGARQIRIVFDGGELEFVRDQERRFAASFVRHRNVITIYNGAEVIEAPVPGELTFDGPEGAARAIESLPELLRRAREQDSNVRFLPDAPHDGQMAVRLETTAVLRLADGPGADGRLEARDFNDVPVKTVFWIDRDTHLPRLIERFGADGRREVTTHISARSLQVDADSEKLLEMAPHPGAREVTR